MNLKPSFEWVIKWLQLELSLLWLMASLPSSFTILQNKYVDYPGDFILGALFPIHRRGSGNDVCGEIQLEDGVQLLEALLFTVDNINKNNAILPGIRLGVLGQHRSDILRTRTLDTCDSGFIAMERSLDFVKGFISHYNEYHEREFHCDNGSPAKFMSGQFDRVIGVIGGQSSSVSIHVAGLLRLFKIPQISYMSTSPQLSDRERFPYFFRTVPSDVNEAAAIIDILRYFNWTYVAVVYSDSEYGVHCYEALRDFAANDSICFTTPQRVIRYQYQDSDYDQIIRTVVNKQNIRVIILILEKEFMIHVMNAARRLGVGSEYVWLGTDGWSSRESVGKEDILEGAIAIQPLVSHIRGFDDYFTGLTPEHTSLNPWWSEFWGKYFKCELSHESPTRNKSNIGDVEESVQDPPCSPDLRISELNGYSQQPFIHFVRDAAYAFAYALHNMHAELCGGVPGVCPEMHHIDGPHLIEYLKNVTFKDEDDNPFRFLNQGDGPTRYTIVNFQRDPSSLNYQWQKVGDYSMRPEGKFELKIEDDRIRYRVSSGISEYPQSTCAKPCSIHQVKVRERDDTCCHICRDCGKFQIKHDDFHCDDCPLGQSPDSLHSTCNPIEEQYIDYLNPLAMAAMIFSGFGILLALFVLKVFWRYNDTPIIKAAGRELSYVLLFGIILSFSATFFIVAPPNQLSCGVVRFFLGFCPTLCYAAILTKTNRIARIFHKSGPSETKFISPSSQICIVAILTSVEVLINAVWIWISPPDSIFTFPDRGTKLRICKGLDDYSYMIGFVYPLILIIGCTIFAIQTRKCPGGFNEAKYIAFTNYCLLIIWLAFVPLYLTSTSNGIRVVTLAISLSLSGLVEMGCLFFPKIYIVLLKPEKNTKEVVMAPNRSSFATLSNSAPVASSNTPKVITSNGNYASSQHLSPEEILISNGSFSDPSC
ncbi:metabotropic glutamate receptor 3 isoform X2 [Folsomia candida]|uniref:metabotropic glutamate receptor 3 isoform X2 n=1 Tax=Folsomia candida TaxID=158441 RepID=UPI001604EB79|nr:metabotropic glutamate receptor 3 isoform X2 [Folsomia candida]